MRTRNSRTTEECCDTLADAMRTSDEIVATDLADGLTISSIHIDRSARINARGESRERFYVNVSSHDGD